MALFLGVSCIFVFYHHHHLQGFSLLARSVLEIGASLRIMMSFLQLLCFWHYPSSGFLHNVSETGFCLRPQVKPTQLGVPEYRRQGLTLSIGPNGVGFTWGRTQNPVSETLKQDDGYVQRQNNCINIPPSQTFRTIFTWAGYQPVAKAPVSEDQGFYSGLPSLRQVAYHG
jgi:hypothetical protein